MTIISKGAEASLFREIWHGIDVVRKHRIPKKYRQITLDISLRRARTRQEAKLLTEARSLGISTPYVFLINLQDTEIIMEFIQGDTMRTWLNHHETQKQKEICYNLGNIIGILHSHDLIHGDLTTSNVIVTKNADLTLLDFGLGGTSNEVEDKGVDLHLFQRTLESSHHLIFEDAFNAFLEGYADKNPSSSSIIQRLWEIDERGRYTSRKPQSMGKTKIDK